MYEAVEHERTVAKAPAGVCDRAVDRGVEYDGRCVLAQLPGDDGLERFPGLREVAPARLGQLVVVRGLTEAGADQLSARFLELARDLECE